MRLLKRLSRTQLRSGLLCIQTADLHQNARLSGIGGADSFSLNAIFLKYSTFVLKVQHLLKNFYVPETSCQAGLFPGVVTEGGQSARRFAFDALIRHSEAVTDVTAVGIPRMFRLPKGIAASSPHPVTASPCHPSPHGEGLLLFDSSPFNRAGQSRDCGSTHPSHAPRVPPSLLGKVKRPAGARLPHQESGLGKQ